MILNESPKDAYGRPIKEGDGVQLVIRGPILFRVARVETVLDPTKPAGLMVIHVFASAAYTVKSGAKHGEFIRVGTAEDLGPLPFSLDQGPGGAES
jgi:hypothetical protein